MKISRIALAIALTTAVTASAFAAGEHCSTDKMKQAQVKLHDALKLTPKQEPAWAKFTATVKTPPCLDKTKKEELGKLTTPERADRMVRRNEAMHDSLVQHAAAATELYENLTLDQQQVMDDFHAKKSCCDHSKSKEPEKTEHCAHE